MKLDFDVAILGAGVSGMTAAIYLKRAGVNCCVIEKEMPGGQINLSPKVENYPGFVDISGVELTSNIFKQLEKLGVDYINEEVMKLVDNSNTKTIITNKRNLTVKKVIIAMGRHPRRLELDSVDKFVGKGISYCATCDGYFFKNKTVAVVGGSNSALEEALYLSDICKSVIIIHRKDSFTKGTEQIYIDKIMSKDNISVEFNSEITSIIEKDSKLNGIRIINNSVEKEISVDGCFVYIGYEPTTEMFKELLDLDKNGYIRIDNNNMTSIDGIYAVGDVVKKDYYQLINAMNDGIKAANQCIDKLK